MEELVKRSIALTESKKRTTMPWTEDEPWLQNYYTYSSSHRRWESYPTSSGQLQPASDEALAKLALYAWNIDFMLPFPKSRMNLAIRYLQNISDRDVPSVIYLQESIESDLEFLTKDAWVQQNFALTDINTDNWGNGHYGTVTLVDRRLHILNCFRIHFSQTRMERDVLAVDIALASRSGNGTKTVRLCNTHLESLALEPPYRPSQMQLIAQHMRVPVIDGAVVAGDFNAIQPFDLHLHTDNDLKDAYLELGGRENDSERGHTWGQQAATATRLRFGTSRMDKVFYCGAMRCLSFDRFGAGVELRDQQEREDIVALGFERPWITDHLGVKALLEVD